MIKICDCGKEFESVNGSKTCSEFCKRIRHDAQKKTYKEKENLMKELNETKEKKDTFIQISEKLLKDSQLIVTKRPRTHRLSVENMFLIQELVKNKECVETIVTRFGKNKIEVAKEYCDRLTR